MGNYMVRILSREAGKWWPEGDYAFNTRAAAEQYADALHADGYAAVTRKGRRLVRHKGITAADARSYGAPATVGLLTEGLPLRMAEERA